MPILLDPALPIAEILREEGYDVRPAGSMGERIRIGLLNLMPNKETTEEHFARVLTHPTKSVQMVPLRLQHHAYTKIDPEHLQQFYVPWCEALSQLDAVIVTGAPVEQLPYEEVGYIEELRECFDALEAQTIPSLFICWGAQAALHHFCGLEKAVLPQKLLGLYEHQAVANDPIFRHLPPTFAIPVARRTAIPDDELRSHPELRVICDSLQSGVSALAHHTLPHVYMFNHFEYTSETIGHEYLRDWRAGIDTSFPYNYYRNEETLSIPPHHWRPHAEAFFSCWIDHAADAPSEEKDVDLCHHNITARPSFEISQLES